LLQGDRRGQLRLGPVFGCRGATQQNETADGQQPACMPDLVRHDGLLALVVSNNVTRNGSSLSGPKTTSSGRGKMVDTSLVAVCYCLPFLESGTSFGADT